MKMSICLICNTVCSTTPSTRPQHSSDGEGESVELEIEVKVVFILRKLLNLPTSQCQDYLQTFGNPSTWINTCVSCTQLVDQGYTLHKQVLEMQQGLNNIRRKVISKIIEEEDTAECSTIKKNKVRKRGTSSGDGNSVIRDQVRNWVRSNDNKEPIRQLCGLNDAHGGKVQMDQYLMERVEVNVKEEPADHYDETFLEKILEEIGGQKKEIDEPMFNTRRSLRCKDRVSSRRRMNNQELINEDVEERDVDDALIDYDFDPEAIEEEDDVDSDFSVSYDGKEDTIGKITPSTRNIFSNHVDEIDGILSCKQCSKTYTQRSSLRVHLNKAHNVFFKKHRERTESTRILVSDYYQETADDGFSCKLCNKMYTQRPSLRVHLNKVHNLFFKKHRERTTSASARLLVSDYEETSAAGFTCKLCNKTFTKRGSIRKHHNDAHNLFFKKKVSESGRIREIIIEPKICSEPGSETKKKKCPRKKIVDVAEIQSCVLCNLTFSSSLEFRNHKLALHRETITETETEARPTVNYLQLVKVVRLTPWKCSECTRWFITQDEANQHESVMHGKIAEGPDVDFKCILCEKSYSTKANLHLHAELDHDGECLANVDAVNILQCDKCSCKFIDESRMEFHMGKVHKILKNPKKKNVGGICPICGLACGNNHLRIHMQLHTGVRHYLCDVCPATFTTPRYLSFHKVRDHGEITAGKNPYGCEKCDRIFSTKNYLNFHVKTVHEKNYKFICEICGAGRQHISAYKQHMLSHGSRKTYKCPHAGCTESYKINSSLSTHISSKHSGKKFCCQFCKKEFSNRRDCKRHELAIHEKNFQHKCSICSKEFPIREYYLNHMKNFHKIRRPGKIQDISG